MKKILLTALVGLSLSSCVLAQGIPPSPSSGPGQNGQKDGPGDMGPGGPGGPGGMGPGGPNGPGGGPGARMQRNNPIDAMSAYIELIQKFTALAKDPTASAVSAVVSVTEMNRAAGPATAADKLTKLLDETKDDAVKRAIRFQLIDLYKAAKMEDKALEQAMILIKQ